MAIKLSERLKNAVMGVVANRKKETFSFGNRLCLGTSESEEVWHYSVWPKCNTGTLKNKSQDGILVVLEGSVNVFIQEQPSIRALKGKTVILPKNTEFSIGTLNQQSEFLILGPTDYHKGLSQLSKPTISEAPVEQDPTTDRPAYLGQPRARKILSTLEREQRAAVLAKQVVSSKVSPKLELEQEMKKEMEEAEAYSTQPTVTLDMRGTEAKPKSTRRSKAEEKELPKDRPVDVMKDL